VDEAFETTFEHGDNCFYLNSIAVGSSIEANLHQSSEVTAGGLGTRPYLAVMMERTLHSRRTNE
jgi:hypothetical protein